MGVFDWIPFAGDALSVAGQMATNAANAKQAQLNRDFQERMSNTAYQRGVKDLKAAGLNPALAYGQGGASAPTGSTATMDNPARGLGSSAAQVMALRNSTSLTKAQIAAATAQAAKTQAETRNQEIENEVAAERAKLEIEGLRYGNRESYERGDRLRVETQMLRDTWEPRFRMAQAQLENMQQSTKTAEASSKLQEIQAALAAADLPRARALARVYESWVGKNMVPWLEPIAKLLNVFLGVMK